MANNRRDMTGAEMQAEVLSKLTQFSQENRLLAERLHQLITEADPTLCPRLWYGMPGYAKTKDSAVLVFFREDEKYMTFGFTEAVTLAPKPDAGDLLMPCAWFFTELNEATELKIAEIVKEAVVGI